MSHDAGNIEESLVEFSRIDDILLEGPLGTDALGLLHICLDRGIVPSVGIVMHLDSELLPNDSCQQFRPCRCQLPYCPDSVRVQPQRCLLSDPEQIAHVQRPHLRLHFLSPERMDLVRLLEVRGHLRQQLVGTDSDIDRESQFRMDSVLQFHSHGHRVLAIQAETHIDEAFINGELFQHRGVTPAYIHKRVRALPVPGPVSPHDSEIRAGAQSHCHRLGCLYSHFFGRNGCGGHNAPPVGRVSGNYRRYKTYVLIALLKQLHSRPAEEGGVHIDMEYNPSHMSIVKIRNFRELITDCPDFFSCKGKWII